MLVAIQLQLQILEKKAKGNDSGGKFSTVEAQSHYQIAPIFGAKNQSPTSSSISEKSFVATQIAAFFPNSLSTPVPKFNCYQTQSLRLKQKPKATLVPCSMDEDPNLDSKVTCVAEMVGSKLEVGVEENEDDEVFIKSCSIQALRKPSVVTSFSRNKVAIIDEWKVLDKMSLRKIGLAIEQGKKRCLHDEDSIKMEVEVTARPMPKPPPKLIFFRESYFMQRRRKGYGKTTTSKIIYLVNVEEVKVRMLSVLWSDKKIRVCGVSVTEQPTLHILRGGKTKLHVSMSYHCPPNCSLDALQQHYISHEHAASTSIENETRKNENLALAWVSKFETKDSIFAKNYSLLGDGETNDSPLLLQVGKYVFKFCMRGKMFYLRLLGKMMKKVLRESFTSLLNPSVGRIWVTEEMQFLYIFTRGENENHKLKCPYHLQAIFS